MCKVYYDKENCKMVIYYKGIEKQEGVRAEKVSAEKFLYFVPDADKFVFCSNDPKLQEWCNNVKHPRVKEKAIRFVVAGAKEYMKGKSNNTVGVNSTSVSSKNNITEKAKSVPDPNVIRGWSDDAVSALNQYCQKYGLQMPKYTSEVIQANGNTSVMVCLTMSDGNKKTAGASNKAQAKKDAVIKYALEVLKVKELQPEQMEKNKKIKIDEQYEFEQALLRDREAAQYELEIAINELSKEADIETPAAAECIISGNVGDFKDKLAEMENVNSKFVDYYSEQITSLLRLELERNTGVLPDIIARADFAVTGKELNKIAKSLAYNDKLASRLPQFQDVMQRAGLKIDDVFSLKEAKEVLAKAVDRSYNEDNKKLVDYMLDYPAMDVNFVVEHYTHEYNDIDATVLHCLAERGNLNLLKKAVSLSSTDVNYNGVDWTDRSSYIGKFYYYTPEFNEDCLNYLVKVQKEGKPSAELNQQTEGAFEYVSALLEKPDTAKRLKIDHLKGTLKEKLPMVDYLFEVPEFLEAHPEGNTGEHTLLALEEVKNSSPMVKYAMLVHELGKIETYKKQIAVCEEIGEDYDPKTLTKHYFHAELGVPLVNDMSKKLGVPQEWQEFAELFCKCHVKAHQLGRMKDPAVYDFNNEIPDKYFEQFKQCCLADKLGCAVSEQKKNMLRQDFDDKWKRVHEVRDFMKKHSTDDKMRFCCNYAKHKKISNNNM